MSELTKKVLLRLTPEEHDLLKAQADAGGQSVNNYVRTTWLGGTAAKSTTPTPSYNALAQRVEVLTNALVAEGFADAIQRASTEAVAKGQALLGGKE